MKQEDYYNDLMGDIPEDEGLDPTDLDYWDRRKRLGVPKAFSSPQELWELACEYFKRIDQNPFKKNDMIRGGEHAGEVVGIPTIRPYTWSGLDAYVFEKNYITDLEDYRANTGNAYKDFQEVVRAINEIMYSQKFEGAAVGAFHHNIIARDLGLVDKSESKNTVIVEQPLFGPDPEVEETKD